MQSHRRQPTRLPRPWDSPGKNTGVGCHFLLQCMKVESESEISQPCPTLRDPMDCSLPGSSVHGIFQARVLEWGAIAFSTVKGKIIHIFHFAGHAVSIATTQLYSCGARAARANEWEWMYPNKTLFTKVDSKCDLALRLVCQPLV